MFTDSINNQQRVWYANVIFIEMKNTIFTFLSFQSIILQRIFLCFVASRPTYFVCVGASVGEMN